MDIDREALAAEFVAEGGEILASMEETLVALEGDPANAELLKSVFRGAHTLKGNASALGLASINEFAHATEDFLARVRSGAVKVTPDLVTALLSAVDGLRQMLGDVTAGIDELRTPHRAILERFAQWGIQGKAAKAAEAPRMFTAPGLGLGDNSRTLRVELEKLDKMLALASEITVFRGRLGLQLDTLGGEAASSILETHRAGDRLFMELQEQVMKLRMIPIGPVFRKYIRTVRDVANAHGKTARLQVSGDEVEVDTRVIEHLKDPLIHLIRNALDHGIEKPAERRAKGKDPCGVLNLSAAHQGGNIVIRLTDDGQGLDRDKILAKAREQGLVEDGSRLSEAEAFELIFEAGFSTSAEVNDLSGRGVGLDVVRRNVELLHGTVVADSRPGQGTSFVIKLPLTMAVIDGFLVRLGPETCTVPLEAVVECLDFDAAEAARGLHAGVMDCRGTALPYVRLRETLGFPRMDSSRESVVVVQNGEMRAGFVVDALLGESQSVVKPLGKLFQGIAGISSSSILENGRVSIILDVPGLMDQIIKETV